MTTQAGHLSGQVRTLTSMSTTHATQVQPVRRAPAATSPALVTLLDVTSAWITSTPGTAVEDHIHARLEMLGVRASDLALWAKVAASGTSDTPYLNLTHILRSQAALDWELSANGQREPRMPLNTNINDALGWLILFCQHELARPKVVREWWQVTDHGWAFIAAGISLPEAANGTGWDWDTLSTMAALRGIRLPERPTVFQPRLRVPLAEDTSQNQPPNSNQDPSAASWTARLAARLSRLAR